MCIFLSDYKFILTIWLIQIYVQGYVNTMDLVDKIVATGTSLGLEGDRFVEFVREHEVKEQKKEEEAVAREERKLER